MIKGLLTENIILLAALVSVLIFKLKKQNQTSASSPVPARRDLFQPAAHVAATARN